jgi:hypothetical protein
MNLREIGSICLSNDSWLLGDLLDGAKDLVEGWGLGIG